MTHGDTAYRGRDDPSRSWFYPYRVWQRFPCKKSLAARHQGKHHLRPYFPPEAPTWLFIPQTQLDQVPLPLNQRPRKPLGFQTPAHRLQASVVPAL